MSDIYVGDHGTLFYITVSDDDGPVDLASASSVTAKFVRGDGSTFTKTLTIVTPGTGACRAVLTRDDLTVPGTYKFQPTVFFPAEDEFNGTIVKFPVKPRL